MTRFAALALALAGALTVVAQDDLDPVAMPLVLAPKEVAIFKDGHAFVLSEAAVPAKSGWYVTYDVPEAILGSLWVYADHPKARVEAVRAGFDVVEKKGPALTLLDTLDGAKGEDVTLILASCTPDRTVSGTVVDVPRADPERNTVAAPAEPIRGETIHVKTAAGVEVLRKDAVTSVTFKSERAREATTRVVRRRILVRVETAADAGSAPVPLRFVYVQKGLRWIPEYRVELLAGKRAKIALQATLVNELADLRGVDAHLVVGIPNFLMKDVLSPLALREAATGLGQYFDSQSGFNNMSNRAMNVQVARYSEARTAEGGPAGAGMDALAKGASADEYFLYRRPGVTVRRGERASFPVFESTFSYQDTYTLVIPPAPPRIIAQNVDDEIRQALTSPKVLHGLKLANAGTTPWTTGPAMIVRDGRALSQGMLRFTPAGGETVLAMAEASDIAVNVKDVEQDRHNTVRIRGSEYAQVFMRGTLCLVNHRKEAITVAVQRVFFGQAEKVEADGKSEAFDFAAPAAASYTHGWGWPHWWASVNGMFQATWQAKVEGGKSVELPVEWSYYRQ